MAAKACLSALQHPNGLVREAEGHPTGRPGARHIAVLCIVILSHSAWRREVAGKLLLPQ